MISSIMNFFSTPVEIATILEQTRKYFLVNITIFFGSCKQEFTLCVKASGHVFPDVYIII